MKNADPSPLAVICIGTASFIVGSLNAGLISNVNIGTYYMIGIIALITGVTCLSSGLVAVSKNSVADSPIFSMYIGTLLAFFALTWLSLGLIFMFMKDGFAGPLALLFLFDAIVCLIYGYFSYILKLWSFVVLMVVIVIGCFTGFLAMLYGWGLCNVISGYSFIALAVIALYLVFKEQLGAILPKKE
jgi:hypothetical protein